jgi:hypothetical protein
MTQWHHARKTNAFQVALTTSDEDPGNVGVDCSRWAHS